MAQSFLGPNPGTVIKDALAPVLLNGAALGSGTTNGTWTQVGRVGHVRAVAVTGTVTGTGVTADIEIQGADDNTGTNTVSYGRFATITEADDAETRAMDVHVYKPFVRAVAVVAGTTPSVPVTVDLQVRHNERKETATA